MIGAAPVCARYTEGRIEFEVTLPVSLVAIELS